MSKQRPSGKTTQNNISSKLLGANLSDINIQKFRDLTQYQKQKYHLSGKVTVPVLKTISNKFSVDVIFTINIPNQAIGNIQALSECTNLMVLNLSSNNIDNISAFKLLTKLRIVNLSNNNITNIDCLSSSKQLTNLHLQGNLIKSVDSLKPIKQCNNLKNLHLQSLSGRNKNPICQLSIYRDNVFNVLQSLKRLDSVPKAVQFYNASQIDTTAKKQLKIQIKPGNFYTSKFPSVGQYSSPSYPAQSTLKKAMGNCKSQIQDLQLKVRALLIK